MYQGMDDDLRYKIGQRRRSLGLEQMDAGELTLRRKDLGITQKQLGSLLGVARNTIARWENETIAFQPLLVDLALETVESYRKKAIKKIEREKKRWNKLRANGTGGETGEPEPEYDSSAFHSWMETRAIESESDESDETTGASDNE
jgi:transcriptional regulator with XRE-family HTH domain